MLKIVAPFDVGRWTLMACATVLRLGQRFNLDVVEAQLTPHQSRQVRPGSVRGAPPSRSARLLSMRRISVRPHLSGAESPIAPNIGRSAGV